MGDTLGTDWGQLHILYFLRRGPPREGTIESRVPYAKVLPRGYRECLHL